MPDIASEFSEHRYCVLRNMLPPHALNLVFQATLLNREHTGYMLWDERTKSYGRYCDAMGEALLLMVQQPLQRRIGRPLIPCYSYLRCYTPESVLPRHVDRPSCEISVTLPVGQWQAPLKWPIWLESGGQDRAIDLAEGDLLVYRGAEVPHWREPLEKGLWVQLFLHYVDAEGDYTEYAMDQRDRIGPVDLPVNDRPGINLPKRDGKLASN